MKSLTGIAIVSTALLAQHALAQPQSPSAGTAVKPQATAPSPQAGSVFVPDSSKPQAGNFAHTNYLLRATNGAKPAGIAAPSETAFGGPVTSAAAPADGAEPSATVKQAETPASMGCLYVKSPNTSGCIPNSSSGTGGPSPAGYGAIAIVDAFDNPDAASDLATFDSYWGLPAPPSFTKIYANGNGSCTTPPANQGWAGEESLDIEWAHVFASNAAIVLVEACSNSFTDLLYAETVAFNYINSNFVGGQVSNSWQGGEYSTEIADDGKFSDKNYTINNKHILAFASSGDSGYEGSTTGFPSSNPWLVSAGGTSILRVASTHKFYKEECWSGSGGGTSKYETYTSSFSGGNTGPWADFQYGIFGQANRATPDMSFNADPASGVWVYSQYGFGGWTPVGGTSVSSPSLASIVNRAGNQLGSYVYPFGISSGYFNNAENNLLYAQLYTAAAYKANFYDVTLGSNGTSATTGWDYCTGVGSPRGVLGK